MTRGGGLNTAKGTKTGHLKGLARHLSHYVLVLDRRLNRPLRHLF
jgi:hypothetical protein